MDSRVKNVFSDRQLFNCFGNRGFGKRYTKLDGLGFMTNFIKSGNNESYQISYHGRIWNILRNSQRYSSSYWTMYIPGTKLEVNLGYNDGESKNIKTKSIVDIHNKTKDKIAVMAKFDRKMEETQIQKVIQENSDYTKKNCGVSISTNVDWSTITDEHIKRYSIGSFCNSPLKVLARLCRNSEEFKSDLSSKVKSVNSKVGKKLESE